MKNITIYGRPRVAKDSEKILVNRCSGKKIICHSVEYSRWINDCYKQLRFKYEYKLEGEITIEMCFHLSEDFSNKIFNNYCVEFLNILTETKVLNTYDINIIKKHKKISSDELHMVVISIL